jgi:hypothetical protein
MIPQVKHDLNIKNLFRPISLKKTQKTTPNKQTEKEKEAIMQH